MPKSDKNKSGFFYKSGVFIGGLILIFISIATIKESYKKRQVQREIDQMKQEADMIEKDNLNLSDKLSYLESRDFQEKEAKDKLSLQSPDENMVIVKQNSSFQSQAPDQEDASNNKKVTVKISNMQKWWNYFFQINHGQ